MAKILGSTSTYDVGLGVLERKSSFFATLRSDRANGLTEHESVYVAENHQFENVFNS